MYMYMYMHTYTYISHMLCKHVYNYAFRPTFLSRKSNFNGLYSHLK